MTFEAVPHFRVNNDEALIFLKESAILHAVKVSSFNRVITFPENIDKDGRLRIVFYKNNKEIKS